MYISGLCCSESLTAYFQFCFLERRKRFNQRCDLQTILNKIIKDQVIAGMYNEHVRLSYPSHVVCVQMKFTVFNYNAIPTNIRNNILKDMN